MRHIGQKLRLVLVCLFQFTRLGLCLLYQVCELCALGFQYLVLVLHLFLLAAQLFLAGLEFLVLCFHLLGLAAQFFGKGTHFLIALLQGFLLLLQYDGFPLTLTQEFKVVFSGLQIGQMQAQCSARGLEKRVLHRLKRLGRCQLQHGEHLGLVGYRVEHQLMRRELRQASAEDSQSRGYG